MDKVQQFKKLAEGALELYQKDTKEVPSEEIRSSGEWRPFALPGRDVDCRDDPTIQHDLAVAQKHYDQGLEAIDVAKDSDKHSTALVDVIESLATQQIFNKSVETFETLMMDQIEKLVTSIDLQFTAEEFDEANRKMMQLRKNVMEVKQDALQVFEDEASKRFSMVSSGAKHWQEVCAAASDTAMKIFLDRVETKVKAENMFLDLRVKEHIQRVAADEREFDLAMKKETDNLELKKKQATAALEHARKQEENAHKKELDRVEAERKRDEAAAKKEEEREKAAHTKELNAIKAKTEKDAAAALAERKKDELAHKKEEERIEAQRKKDEAAALKEKERENNAQLKELNAIKAQQERDEAAAQKEKAKLEREHQAAIAKMEIQAKKQEEEHQKEMQRCDKAMQKELATAQKQSQIDKDRHALLSQDLAAQMKLYDEEFKAAKEMMSHAMQQGKSCRIEKHPPYLDFKNNEVVRGWVKAVLS